MRRSMVHITEPPNFGALKLKNNLFKMEKKEIKVSENKIVEVLTRACPDCGNALRIINGRKGKFISCTTWPECGYTEDLEPKY